MKKERDSNLRSSQPQSVADANFEQSPTLRSLNPPPLQFNKASTQLQEEQPETSDAGSVSSKLFSSSSPPPEEGSVENMAFSTPGQLPVQRAQKGVLQRKYDLSDTEADDIVAKVFLHYRKKLYTFLAKGLGKDKSPKFNSTVRDFRDEMKTQARSQVKQDISDEFTNIQQGQGNYDLGELEFGSAMQEYSKMEAIHLSYKESKAAVKGAIGQRIDTWLGQNWTNPTTPIHYRSVAQQASGRTRFGVRKEAKKLMLEEMKPEYKTAKDLARNYRSELRNPNNQKHTDLIDDIKTEASAVDPKDNKNIAQRAVQKTITANTGDEGMGLVGAFLDQAIPQAGETVSLDITLQIPFSAAGYVSIGISGKAGRGITGFSTSGVATLGNKKRLEVMAQFSIGVGAEVIGMKGDVSLSFFMRSGSDLGTAATMKALSYGVYRFLGSYNSGPGKKIGHLWAGAGKNKTFKKNQNDPNSSRTVRAEKWAAAIEEQVFLGPNSDDKNSFVDLGGGLGASGGLNLQDLFTLEGNLGGELFRRYDADSMDASGLDDQNAIDDLMGGDKGSAKDAAKDRKKNSHGRATGSFGISASFGVNISGQPVTFSGSFSFEKSSGEGNEIKKNWGVEISAEIGYGSDPSKLEKITVGVLNGLAGVMQQLAALSDKGKVGSGVNLLTEFTQITNAGLDNKITDGLAKAWQVDGSKFDVPKGGSEDAVEQAAGIGTSSSLQLAFTFGRSGGDKVWRFELRDTKNVDINIGIGGTGMSISASKGRRIFAAGAEGGEGVGEALGLR